MRKVVLVLSIIFISLINNSAFAVLKTSTGADWNNLLHWSPNGVPLGGDVVTINSNMTITGISTAVVNGVTINAGVTLTISNNTASTLVDSGTIIVNGTLTNNGGIDFQVSGKNFVLNAGATYTHNPFNNTLGDESIFYFSNENFNPTSNLIIQNWFNLSVPLGHPSRVQTSNFGHVTLSVPMVLGSWWDQDGYFTTSRIKGTFTVTSGTIMMDDGTGGGGAVSLVLQWVRIIGTGNVIFQAGPNRNLSLVTGTFTDSSTSTLPTIVLDTTYSLLSWNVNGDLNLNHDFNALWGTGTDAGGDVRITVTGNVLMTGGSIELVKAASADCRLIVTGNTTISGNPTKVRFVDGNNGLLIFTTGNFYVSAGASNILMGGNPAIPKAMGSVTVTINNDFLINGVSNTFICNSDSNLNKVRVTVGGNFNMSVAGAQLVSSYHLGAHTFKTTGDFLLSNGQFTGIGDTLNAAIDSIIVGGNFTYSSPLATDFFRGNYGNGATVIKTTGNFSVTRSGTASGQGVIGIYQGGGNLVDSVGGAFTLGATAAANFNGIYNLKNYLQTGSLVFTVAGAFTQTLGTFKGINSPVLGNSGIITFSVNSLSFSGGIFSAYHTSNLTSGNGTFNIANNCTVNFIAATDSFAFHGLALSVFDLNTLALNLTIGGNLTISGAANGVFISSMAKAPEVVNITGGFTISAGTNSFNSYPGSVVGNQHKVTMTIGGNMSVTGGTSYLSAFNDSLIATVNGNLSQTAGNLTVQAGYTYGSLNVLGGYNQTGGTFYLHNNTVSNLTNNLLVTINSNDDATGDFSHTGGTINFDNNTNGNLSTLIIKSPNVTYGGSGSMTHGNPGTSTYWGILHYSHAGTTLFTRTVGSTHNIQQVKQYILGGTTLNVQTGNVQVASYVNTFTLDMLTVQTGAIITLGTSQIYSNALQANSGITVVGRLRTQNVNGFFDNTAAAALNFTGGMNYLLQVGSTVEYYGTATQKLTGYGFNIAGTGALAALHKYYNLEIAFTGPANTSWVYADNNPSVNAVYVRKNLVLTSGELNLDNDHITASGGRNIILEDTLITAIARNGTTQLGYIRSEVEDGSANVKWRIKTQTGNHVIPFGYDAAAVNYIPFTFGIPSGNADTLIVSTYHTNALNTPYPPTVTHVRNNTGADNSGNTVDRFWFIKSTGTVSNSNMSFICTAAELGAITNPRAQRWIPAPQSWEMPYQGAQLTLALGTQVTGAVNLPNWWTLSGIDNPLPVELVNFDGNCKNENIELNWTTATEINNSHFVIERSFDGSNYENIGIKDGHGNSSTANSYSFIDENPVSGLNYYILRQVDFDGKNKEYGPVVVKSCKEIKTIQVAVSTSGNSNANLLVQSPYADKFKVSICDIEGKVLMSDDMQIEIGGNIIKLNTSSLSSGIYLVKLEGELDVLSKKFFVRRN